MIRTRYCTLCKVEHLLSSDFWETNGQGVVTRCKVNVKTRYQVAAETRKEREAAMRAAYADDDIPVHVALQTCIGKKRRGRKAKDVLFESPTIDSCESL